MASEPMTLIERLRNPQWVHRAFAHSGVELDKDQTQADMGEAADEIERLRAMAARAAMGRTENEGKQDADA